MHDNVKLVIEEVLDKLVEESRDDPEERVELAGTRRVGGEGLEVLSLEVRVDDGESRELEVVVEDLILSEDADHLSVAHQFLLVAEDSLEAHFQLPMSMLDVAAQLLNEVQSQQIELLRTLVD